MTTVTQTQRWDLTHLFHGLPAIPAPTNAGEDDPDPELEVPSGIALNSHELPSATGLGDFSKVWQFLGTDPSSGLGAIIPSKEDYASDGAISGPAPPRASTPHIFKAAEDVKVDMASGYSNPTAEPEDKLSKRQQRKERERARHEKGQAKNEKRAPLALSESECDSNAGRVTPARKASHHMMTRSMSAKMQTDHVSNEKAVKSVAEDALLEDDELPDTPCPRRVSASPSSVPIKVQPERPVPAAVVSAPSKGKRGVSKPVSAGINKAAPPALPLPVATPISLTPKGHPGGLPKQPVEKPHGNTSNVYKTNGLIPSSIQPPKRGNTPNTASKLAKKEFTTPTIEPITLRSGADRDLALYLKIIKNFGADLAHLVRPMNLTTHNNSPTGIHVFVDASNIFIGFADQLKRSRNIHHMQRVPEVNLSFDSLALLIERRRPVAKRVLVGSTPHVAAFDKARAVGYEVSILEKVMKSRELTERQIYFKEVDARRSGRKSSTSMLHKPPPPHKIALAGSVLTPRASSASAPEEMIGLADSVLAPREMVGRGLETTTPLKFERAKLVEQGVDEILHLKMMESLLDTEQPGTMVLATGDAAMAEYSSGFAAMVERALRKGWSVELTSWSKNISSMYKQPAWTEAWKERFRIIELDEYAEELLDM